MRTPVVLVAGQGDSDAVAGTLMDSPGTLVVGHEYDGQVVRRWVSIMRNGELSTSELALELANGCVDSTTRNDLVILVRRLHARYRSVRSSGRRADARLVPSSVSINAAGLLLRRSSAAERIPRRDRMQIAAT